MRTNQRVVITGLGVVTAQALNIEAFNTNLQTGKPCYSFLSDLKTHNFQCQVGSIAQADFSKYQTYLEYMDVLQGSDFVRLGCVAGLEAWEDAGLPIPDLESDAVDWDTGMVIGSGASGTDTIGLNVVPNLNAHQPKKIGSLAVQNVMGSGATAHLAPLLGIGNKTTSNSSACCTGTEAIIDGYYRIKFGLAQRMVVGGAEGYSLFTWATFDAARVTNRKFNDRPNDASRPMSGSAKGFVPASGAGVLVLESLESALERGAKIYAEISGGMVNSGGQRNGGTMTFPNVEGVQRCIRGAIERAKVALEDIDLISGHLTATKADPMEVQNWATVFESSKKGFPFINAPKSMLGHSLGAAGAIESIACILQIANNYIHPSINCEDVHPRIAEMIPVEKIPHKIQHQTVNTIIKSSFGFGDVNACIIFKKWDSKNRLLEKFSGRVE